VKWLLAVVFAGIAWADATTAFHILAAANACEQGKAELRSMHFQTAIEDFRRAIKIEPTYLEAFEGLIDALLKTQDREQAAAALTQLLEIEPDRSKDRITLGQLLLQEQQAQRALAQFAYVLHLEPTNADALFGFATAAKGAGMPDRAAEALAKGRREHPQDPRFTKGQ
jgi:tetratricopeptide (TPR) repeat protein